MKIRALSLQFLTFVVVWLGSAATLAAPPRDRGSALDFLSDEEVARLQAVESFDVTIEPMLEVSTAKTLAEACTEIVTLVDDIPNPTDVDGIAILKGEIAGGDAATLTRAIYQIRALRKPNAEKTAQAVQVATMLSALGHGIADLCTKVATGSSTEEDFVLLRAIYAEDAKTIATYHQLITKPVGEEGDQIVAQLLSKVVESPEDSAVELIGVLSTEFTGQPQSLSVLNLGSAAAANIFEGLAEFLIDRAKEETLEYVRDTLVQRICGSDLQAFVPRTCSVVNDLDPNMALSAIGKMLHAAVIEDLVLMPDRQLVLAWMRVPDVAYPATLVRLALPMLEEAKLHKDPLAYAVSIHSMPATDCETSKLGGGDTHCALVLAYLRMSSAMLRASVRTTAGNSAEPPFASLGVAFDFEAAVAQMPLSARELLKAELGAAPGLVWSSDATLTLTSVGLMTLGRLITDSISLSMRLEKAMEELGKTNLTTGQSTATPARLVIVARSTIDALTQLSKLAIELSPNQPPPSLQLALANSSKLVAASDLQRSEDWGRYTLEMLAAVSDLIEICVDPSQSDAIDEAFDSIDSYLPLLVEIANAKSSADVKAALEAAFPAGGFKRKYREPAVSLNGFLGIYGGGTVSNSLDTSGELQFGTLGGEFSMFAPIGMHVTAPVAVHRKRPSHLGVLFTVIDLGAITTSKWLEQEANPEVTSGTTTSQTEIGEPRAFNIAGIVAPGGYFTIGVANSPFVLGFGASFEPFAHKRTITERDSAGDIQSTDEKLLPAVRFGAFLAVDITFVSFGLR